ncbi:hypothetical protein K2173_008856 [Erythroxylum novogranatense]|uniref:Cytoplasmic tRNA 2-thiolation protein 2 n=1 Tax=Erythroxylum novogranatense TaxID=1862640 RepID=A0AAV8U9C8_9ROSI|nr:hypothetical protein K2173_008856 [Erythroxylum novogranatense]
MACNSSTCQSSCFRNEDNINNVGEHPRDTVPIETSKNRTSVEGEQPSPCVKCKTNRTISAVGSPSGENGGDAGKFCGDCFRSNLYGKFRLSVTSHAMIIPSDNVLVAFSGGSASSVVLQFVHEMQHRAQKNFEASRDRSLPVFGVGVAFIDESAVYPVASNKYDKSIQQIKSIVYNLPPPLKPLHIVPITDIYPSDSGGKDRLGKLLDAVNDITGKEDLILHLRMLALQKVASEKGYNKLILGSCTSSIACHVISSIVKGQGYSLSADIQYVDARWEIPVVLPLRDCTAQELNLLCWLDGLKTVELLNSRRAGINSLVSSFVTLLQEENPSRESTIVRTAGKLKAFHFNRIPEINDCDMPLATQRRIKRYNQKPQESISSEFFCPICNSPLDNSELLSLSAHDGSQSSKLNVCCCSSCKQQIRDCLLSDNEDET